MHKRIFGPIPGVPVNSTYTDRKALCHAGVHRRNMHGISGSIYEGADSIVISGGYEDDEDHGDLIIYTGEGGNDTQSKKQTADQTLTGGNLALAKSCLEGLPVRVIRGYRHHSPFSPLKGYRYEGLYSVEKYWHEVGKSGFQIWRYLLVKIPDDITIDQNKIDDEFDDSIEVDNTQYKMVTVCRRIRNSAAALKVKELHDYRCQVCALRLETKAGYYNEAAHIRPLGKPHNGPDCTRNILCLCPNHHVLFDLGGFGINDDFSLIGLDGVLITVPQHKLDKAYLSYHCEHVLI